MTSKVGEGNVRSVERALAILELLGEHGDLGLEELHYLTGLPKATVSRLLNTLQEQGWLYRSPTDRRYQLCARRLFGDVGKRLRRGLVEHSAPYLCELSERTGLVVDFSYFDGNDLSVIESCIPQVWRKRYPLNRMSTVWSAISLFNSAMGKACLGALGEDDMQRLALHHAVAIDSLHQAHRQTHSQGFGQRTEGSWEFPVKLPFTIRAVALPVYARERLVGSVALHWPSDQGSVEEIQRQHMGALAATVCHLGTALSAIK